MYKKLFFIFIILTNFYCSNDNQQISKNVDTISNNEIKTKQTIDSTSFETNDIISLLNIVPNKYRTKIINNYFAGNKDLLIDNNFKFASFEDKNDSSDVYVYVQNIFQNTKQNILLFSIYFSNHRKFINSFYFVQNINNEWYPTTKLLVGKSIIDYLTKKFNTTIFYRPYENTYCYITDSMDYPFYFDFSSTPCIKAFLNKKWEIVENISFNEDVFYIEENQTQNNIEKNDIDNAPVYYDLNSAVSDSSNVYVLDLSSSYLSEIAPKIRKLKNLKILSINDNNLQYLPICLTELKNLSILRAENNQIQILPDNIGDLQNLEQLSLSNNSIISLPVSFYELKNLKFLSLDNNNLNSFDDFSKLKLLITCDLSNNNISYLPSNIDSLKSLVSLDISNNPISSLPESIFNLKQLRYLNIKGTNIPDNVAVKLFEINADIRIDMN